jgi:hypothetical protein
MLVQRKGDFMATSKKESAETTQAANTGPVTFSKSHILTFKRYANRRDLLSVLLEEDQRYTMEQVDGLIQKFLTPKGKVK